MKYKTPHSAAIFLGLFLQARGGGMAPLPPPPWIRYCSDLGEGGTETRPDPQFCDPNFLQIISFAPPPLQNFRIRT